MKQVILHGEAMVFESEIPIEAAPLGVVGDYLIVADSETTGNHHVVDKAHGVTFYQAGQRRFMRVATSAKIRCLHEKRHDAVEIPPGSYEFGTQQEYDPFTANMRNVRD